MLQYNGSSELICLALTLFQVYNETIRDLLMPGKALALREDPQRGVCVSNLTLHQVSNRRNAECQDIRCENLPMLTILARSYQLTSFSNMTLAGFIPLFIMPLDHDNQAQICRVRTPPPEIFGTPPGVFSTSPPPPKGFSPPPPPLIVSKFTIIYSI